ncbi:hypothetical protein DMENIID0001_003810 [Sergentomyia squamirostris]
MSSNSSSSISQPKRIRLADSEDAVNSGAGTSRERPVAEREISSRSSEGSSEANISENTSSSGVSSTLSINDALEGIAGDECALDADVLRKFHQQKLNKCILENTANRILESYQFFLRPNDFTSSQGSGEFENAAILMAINEHGLTPSSFASTEGAIPPSQYDPANVSEKEHLDFMETAVAVAIQKKGLTPFTLSPHR